MVEIEPLLSQQGQPYRWWIKVGQQQRRIAVTQEFGDTLDGGSGFRRIVCDQVAQLLPTPCGRILGIGPPLEDRPIKGAVGAIGVDPVEDRNYALALPQGPSQPLVASSPSILAKA